MFYLPSTKPTPLPTHWASAFTRTGWNCDVFLAPATFESPFAASFPTFGCLVGCKLIRADRRSGPSTEMHTLALNAGGLVGGRRVAVFQPSFCFSTSYRDLDEQVHVKMIGLLTHMIPYCVSMRVHID